MSSTTSTKTKAAALARVQAIIAGTTKHFPNGSFTIGSAVYTSASLIQVLHGLANAMTARNAAEAGAKDALAAEQTAETQVCLADLDKARAADPGGDDAPVVKGLRDKAIAEIVQKPEAPPLEGRA